MGTMNYTIFFDSLKEFILKTDARKYVLMSGVSSMEIDSLEQRLQRKLPSYLKEYLKLFGKEFSFYNTVIHEYFVSYSAITDTLTLFDKYEIKQILAKMNTEGVTDFIPLYDDEHRFQIMLLNPMSDKGESYLLSELYLGENNEVYDPEEIEFSSFHSFFDNLRERLFLEISLTFSSDGKTDNINLNEVNWTKFHVCYCKKDRMYSADLLFDRDDFSTKMCSYESDHILSIDEYENLFIRYLIEEKGVPPIPEIYDPYK